MMDSKSKGKDGEEGTSGVKRRIQDEQERQFVPHHTNGFADPLVDQLLLRHGRLRAYDDDGKPPPPPTLLMPQQRRGGVVAQPHPNGTYHVECVVHQRLKSVKIRWNHGGTNVAIAGSWDNWETTEPLQSVGEYFVIVKTLPVGIYHYHFIVDGYFTHAPDFPSAPPLHDSGYAYNILDLQDYIPQALARLSESEDPPPSPPSSYDNILLNDDEFNKPPPELPPQLPVILRQELDSTSSTGAFVPSRNTHLELNHLYIHKTDGEQFVALRSTHRFHHKYVTMVLYKSLLRER